MEQEIKTKLTDLARKVACRGMEDVFEDVLDILQMVNQTGTMIIYVGGFSKNIPVEIHKEISDLLAHTKKIPAIKRLRKFFLQTQPGCPLGLKDAKDAVEDHRNWDTWDTAPKQLPPDCCEVCVNFTKHPNFPAVKNTKEGPESMDVDSNRCSVCGCVLTVVEGTRCNDCKVIR